ncbi:hypothetical protein FRC12_020617 [Ceratobasidium sp. 428]|nr:hypothetical protein FRC12_020617 [Ceratobasidium sp. 428]
MAYPLMPRRAAPILPNEILMLILELLENPSAVSLVSCLFYHLAFPLVHHTLEFTSGARTKEFLDRVLSEDDEEPLRISQALRRLTVFEEKSGHDYTCPVDDKLLARFRYAIPKLVNLEQLNWRIPYELDDTDVLIDFQRFCPRLQSLDLTANSQQFVERSKIFEFRNLTHLQAMLRGNLFDSSHFNLTPNSLLVAIQASPLLHTLVLRPHLHAYFDPEVDVDMNHFFQTLDTSLPHLRHLEIRSRAKLEWNHILNRTQGFDPIRSFFLGSSKIETLIIDWIPESPINNPDLRLVRDMFPALRHFTGPERISAVLLSSDVRLRLETLKILPSDEARDVDAYATIVHAATELPQLRSLCLPVRYIDPWDVQPEGEFLFSTILKQHLRAAPELESLELNCYALSPNDILEPVGPMIQHAKLRQVSLSGLPLSSTTTGSKLNANMMAQLAITCPQLERLTICDSLLFDFSENHRFERDNEGRLERTVETREHIYAVDQFY